MAAATPAALGSQRSTSTPKTRPTATRDDLARPPSRQRAAALARAETVARRAVFGRSAHPASPPSPGGHAGGNETMRGPWPSSPM